MASSGDTPGVPRRPRMPCTTTVAIAGPNQWEGRQKLSSGRDSRALQRRAAAMWTQRAYAAAPATATQPPSARRVAAPLALRRAALPPRAAAAISPRRRRDRSLLVCAASASASGASGGGAGSPASAAERYAARGVSASKEDVHAAIADLDKGLFPSAFCKARGAA